MPCSRPRPGVNKKEPTLGTATIPHLLFDLNNFARVSHFSRTCQGPSSVPGGRFQGLKRCATRSRAVIRPCSPGRTKQMIAFVRWVNTCAAPPPAIIRLHNYHSGASLKRWTKSGILRRVFAARFEDLVFDCRKSGLIRRRDHRHALESTQTHRKVANAWAPTDRAGGLNRICTL
jgi:hypothetical protein